MYYCVLRELSGSLRFLSSIGSIFIIFGDIDVHMDVECCDKSRFSDILQCCNTVQGDTDLLIYWDTHWIYWFLLVTLICVWNVGMGDLKSDHAVIRCQLDKSLADKFALFFCDKINKILDTFPTSGYTTNTSTLALTAFNSFEPVSEHKVSTMLTGAYTHIPS